MVYGFLAVTPMHNLVVAIGLVFFTAAAFALICQIYEEGRFGLLFVGLLCIAVPMTNAILYYTKSGNPQLAVVQKAGMASWGLWVLCVYYRRNNAA